MQTYRREIKFCARFHGVGVGLFVWLVGCVFLLLSEPRPQLLSTTWQIPAPPQGHIAVAVQGDVVLFGGYSGSNNYHSFCPLSLTPRNSRWSENTRGSLSQTHVVTGSDYDPLALKSGDGQGPRLSCTRTAMLSCLVGFLQIWAAAANCLCWTGRRRNGCGASRISAVLPLKRHQRFVLSASKVFFLFFS